MENLIKNGISIHSHMVEWDSSFTSGQILPVLNLSFKTPNGWTWRLNVFKIRASVMLKLCSFLHMYELPNDASHRDKLVLTAVKEGPGTKGRLARKSLQREPWRKYTNCWTLKRYLPLPGTTVKFKERMKNLLECYKNVREACHGWINGTPISFKKYQEWLTSLIKPKGRVIWTSWF